MFCEAVCILYDEEGKNNITIRCDLAEGHEGKHKMEYEGLPDQNIVIQWDRDEVTDNRTFVSCNNCHQCKEINIEGAFNVELDPKQDKIITPCPFCGEKALVMKCYRDIFDAGWREEEYD